MRPGFREHEPQQAVLQLFASQQCAEPFILRGTNVSMNTHVSLHIYNKIYMQMCICICISIYICIYISIYI